MPARDPELVRPQSRFLARTLSGLLALAAILAAAPVRAQVMDANPWVTDGDVATIVPHGNTVYIGGSFAYVGPNTGGWTALDEYGRATAQLPRVNGDVRTTLSDGAGGWWVGGTFTQIAGIARPGLAHVLADGSVSPWNPLPPPNGAVCLAQHGSRLFVSTGNSLLLAFDTATGDQIPEWSPAVLGPVHSMVVDGTTLFAGGQISFTITTPVGNGNGVAAIDVSTGDIANWDPAPDGEVTKLYREGRWLYVTGSFTTIAGQAHEMLARALLPSRAFDGSWTPSVDAPVAAFARVGGGLWIAGGFFFVNGGFFDRIAVVDTTTGASTGPTPSVASADGYVTAMVQKGPNVYLGMSPYFTFPIQSSRPFILRMDAAGQLDPNWRALGLSVPTNDVGNVTELALSPDGQFVASGHFVSLGGRRQVAAAALDRATGIPRTWNPDLSVTESFPIVPRVSAILPTSHAIYLGGYFTKAAGQVRKSLAAVDSVHGSLRPWKADLGPNASLEAGQATSLALYQDKILVGGAYSSIGGVAKAGLAQVDSVVGTPVAAWTCDVTDQVNCLLVLGSTVYVGGGFSTIGGQSHNDLAAVNAATGAVSTWNPNVAGVQVWALAAKSDTMYIAGDYSQVGGQTRNCLAAVTVSAGSLLGWAPAAFGPAMALLINGPNIVVGGEFQFLAGQPVSYLGSIDRFTGALVTGVPTTDARVLSLASTNGTTWIGGSFGSVGPSPTAFLARFGGNDVNGPAVTVVLANGGEYLTVGTTYRFEWTASDASGVASVDLELSRTGAGGPWTTVAAGLANDGSYTWLVAAPNAAGNAFLRVTARDFAGNTANDLSNAAFSIGAPVASVASPGGVLASFALGPNPARSTADLVFALRADARIRFRLLDVQGRVVWAAPEQSFAAGAHRVPLGLRGVAPGLYFLRFDRGAESVSTRLVVVR